MITEKLYYKDAYIKEFSATVLECEKCDKGFRVVLDSTAFFPEAGGQPCDIGTIGEADVFDVQIDKSEIVHHYTNKALSVGQNVECKLNFDRRFDYMQNHTGEHIVSGIANRLFGCQNVGFHLSGDFATVDFDIVLSREQIDEIEALANEAVWKNYEVNCFFPDDEQLKTINYRSKKELEGAIRLVEIENTDMCACCAPHVAKTGEIGFIKLLDFERMRSGIRIIMKCGRYALDDYQNKYANVREISALLSSKQEITAQAVKELLEKLNAEQQKSTMLKKRYIDRIIDSADADNPIVFEDDLDMKELQLLADGLHKSLGVLSAAFSACEGGYHFAMCDEDSRLQEFFSRFKSQFTVKGGGRNGMVQGTVNSDNASIKKFFEG